MSVYTDTFVYCKCIMTNFKYGKKKSVYCEKGFSSMKTKKHCLS